MTKHKQFIDQLQILRNYATIQFRSQVESETSVWLVYETKRDWFEELEESLREHLDYKRNYETA